MGAELIIQEFKNGQNTTLAKLSFGRVVVGREPDDPQGIKILSSAVSRNHGEFKSILNLWLYEDLGSTNGSWLNGNELVKNLPYVISPGDIIQLADSVLHIRGNMPASACLAVFNGQDFIAPHEIPEFGKALVFGGAEATYEVNSEAETPSLVFEKRGDKIAAFQVNKEISATINNESLVTSKFLEDRDEIKIENYRIILLDPPKDFNTTLTEKSLPTWEPEPTTGGLKVAGVKSETAPVPSSFGAASAAPGATGTIAINPQEISDYSHLYQPSRVKNSRVAHGEAIRKSSTKDKATLTGIEKALVAFIIVTVLIALVLLVGFFIR